jgi:hypothetical protein
MALKVFVRSVRLHHPLRVETRLLTPTIDIGKEATAARAVRSEGIESTEIKTQSGPVVKARNGHRRTQVAQILELLEADVLLAVSIIRSGGVVYRVVGSNAPTFERTDITSGGGTVPTIVSAAHQNRVSGANSSPVVGSGMFRRGKDVG